MTGVDSSGAATGSPESKAEEVLESLGDRRLVVLLDYDGTLSPIAPRPKDALLPEATRQVLRDLGKRCPTAIISGRSLADVRELVRLEGLVYAGNHGLEIEGPASSGIRRNLGEEFVSEVAGAAAELEAALVAIDGSLVENKRYSLSVHYRLVSPEQISAVEAAVDAAVTAHPRLEKRLGKKVFELRPALDWDKGKAVRWLLETVENKNSRALPVYLGDDVTDEDAFRELTDDGIGILISKDSRATSATYRLHDTDEARRFLARLAAGSDA